MSATLILQTREHVHNVCIQWWSCFVDSVSSRTKVTQRPQIYACTCICIVPVLQQ